MTPLGSSFTAGADASRPTVTLTHATSESRLPNILHQLRRVVVMMEMSDLELSPHREAFCQAVARDPSLALHNPIIARLGNPSSQASWLSHLFVGEEQELDGVVHHHLDAAVLRALGLALPQAELREKDAFRFGYLIVDGLARANEFGALAPLVHTEDFPSCEHFEEGRRFAAELQQMSDNPRTAVPFRGVLRAHIVRADFFQIEYTYDRLALFKLGALPDPAGPPDEGMLGHVREGASSPDSPLHGRLPPPVQWWTPRAAKYGGRQ